jgi:methionyl-tRNA formyltransferase
MRIIFFGCTHYSRDLLESLLNNNNANIVGVFSIPEEFSISYSEEKVKNTNYASLKYISKEKNIPFFEVDSVEGKKTTDYTNIISELKPDVILVLGWYYMVPKSIRDIPKYGSWGIHASLLPDYAGGAPLVWAIINGEKKAGVTLFRMEGGVDDGDIISQVEFTIQDNDTIKEVYEKATISSKQILNQVLNVDFKVTFTKQDKSKIKIYPQRSPKDGLIDWSWEPARIKNFIRAQTKPYPGAFTIIEGKKVTIWDADVSSLSK